MKTNDFDRPTGGSPAAVAQSPRRRRSVIGIVLALLLLALLGWLAWHLTHGNAAQHGARSGPGAMGGRGGPPATTVGVATADHADIPVVLDALGTIVPSANATVRPQVTGVLKKILFTEGQTVKAGQVLAQIDPSQFQMTFMQASGQLQRDEAQLENARVTLKRYQTLLAQDSIARQDVDTQAALVKQLEGTIAADRAAQGTAKINLGYTSVTAPIGGRIGLRAADVGNVIGPNDANGIAAITQMTPIDVSFAVPQDRISELRMRINDNAPLPVTVLDRTRTQVLDSGRFLALDNEVDAQTGTVRAKARLANEKQLLFPNQFVNVRLLIRTIQNAVVVPVTALRHGGNGDFVYVLNPAQRTVSLRTVQRGEATVDKVQIASGLNAGEQVITEGADRLKDGAHVMLPGDKPQFGAGHGGKGGWRGRQGGQGGQPGGNASAADTQSGAPARQHRGQQQNNGQ